MNSIVKIFSFALFLGSALGGGSRHYRGVTVLSSEPVYTKSYSAPIAYSKSVAVPAVATYAEAPVAAYHAPAAYSSPYYAQAVAAPAAVQYAAAPAYAYAAPAHVHSDGHHAHVHAPAALTYASPAIPAAPVALLSTAGKPQTYGKSIPAAAIRNVETVMVTKTITPVVTKTTTHHTAAEPALSVGYVQGYSQAATGHPKLAPVQFNTQYTSYANPTVGVNGPVIYSGGAVGVAPVGVAAAAVAPVGVAAAAVPEPVAAVYKSPAYAVAAAPAAVYKSPAYAVAAAPAAVYKTAAVAAAPSAYSLVPGAALSYDTYGLDAHSVPVSNFLELRSGKAVLSGYHK